MRTEIGTIVLALLIVCATAVRAETDLEAAHRAAAEAARAYEDQDFEKAVDLFERAIELGLDHPTLRYDLGNAYYKTGDLGRAILWYERARRDAPRDRAIRHNLAQARSQMQDQEFSTHVMPVLFRPLGFVRDLLSLDGWSKLLIASLVILCGVGIWRQWSPAPPPPLARVAQVLVAMVLLSGAMTAAWYHERFGSDAMIVVAEEVDVHSGPGADYDLAFRVHSGLRVVADERREGWVRIDLGGELIGWIPSSSVEEL